MPRYYFDIADGEAFPDRQGVDLPDLAAARVEAVRFAAEVLKEMPERFWHCELWTMTISDTYRRPVFTLKFLAEDATPKTPADTML